MSIPISSVFEVMVPLTEMEAESVRLEQKKQYLRSRNFLIISVVGLGAVGLMYVKSFTVLMVLSVVFLLFCLLLTYFFFKKARLLEAGVVTGKKNRLTTHIQEVKLLFSKDVDTQKRMSFIVVVNYPYEKTGQKSFGIENQPDYLPQVGEQVIIDYLPYFMRAFSILPLPNTMPAQSTSGDFSNQE